MNNLIKLSSVLLFLAVFSMHASHADAAVIKAITKESTFGLNGEYRVEIIVDTEGKNINAIEGEVLFPKDLITLKAIEDGESIVGLWIQNPKELIEISGNKIIFSGVIPNGFIGHNGLVATLIFVSEEVGKGSIQVSKGKVLVNDGSGASIPVLLPKLNFSVDGAVVTVVETATIDTTSPDEFKVQVLKGGPELYNGQYFIIFNTHDSESGVDHYELFESVNALGETELIELDASKWKKVSNPAILADQTLSSFIYVKAVDRQGNFKISVVDGATLNLSTDNGYKLTIISVIMILCVVVAFITIKNKRNRKRRVFK